MNDFVVKKTSWHYRAMKRFYSWNDYNTYKQPKDFCTYWRKFFYMGLVFLALAALAAGALGLLLFHAINTPGPFFAGLTAFIAMAGVVCIIITLVYYITEKATEYSNEISKREPGLVRTKYRSFKDKYCPMVRIED